MQSGKYDSARVVLRRSDGIEEDKELLSASIKTHLHGIVEIVHYEKGLPLSEGKRTIFVPTANLIVFLGRGYAQ